LLCLIGLLCRGHRFAGGFNTLVGGAGIEKCLADILAQIALQFFQLLLAQSQFGASLSHLGTDLATAKQRQGQVEGCYIAFTFRCGCIFKADVTLLGQQLQVEVGVASALRLTQASFSRLDSMAGSFKPVIAVDPLLNPGIRAGQVPTDKYLLAQRRKGLIHLATNQLGHRLPRQLHLVLGINFLAQQTITAGFHRQKVGDHGQLAFVAGLDLTQLLFGSLTLRHHKLKVILCRQHLGIAVNQIDGDHAFRILKARSVLIRFTFGAAVAFPLGLVIKRLGY